MICASLSVKRKLHVWRCEWFLESHCHPVLLDSFIVCILFFLCCLSVFQTSVIHSGQSNQPVFSLKGGGILSPCHEKSLSCLPASCPFLYMHFLLVFLQNILDFKQTYRVHIYIPLVQLTNVSRTASWHHCIRLRFPSSTRAVFKHNNNHVRLHCLFSSVAPSYCFSPAQTTAASISCPYWSSSFSSSLG